MENNDSECVNCISFGGAHRETVKANNNRSRAYTRLF